MEIYIFSGIVHGYSRWQLPVNISHDHRPAICSTIKWKVQSFHSFYTRSLNVIVRVYVEPNVSGDFNIQSSIKCSMKALNIILLLLLMLHIIGLEIEKRIFNLVKNAFTVTARFRIIFCSSSLEVPEKYPHGSIF